MSSRKDFLKQLVSGLLAGSIVQWNPLSAQMPRGENVDWDQIRSFFRPHDGWTYLNAGTLGLMPDQVVDELERQVNKRVRRGSYPLLPNAADVAAEFFRVSPDEVVITNNTTEGLNIVAQGLPLRSRDEVIISDQEHVGHALPWLNRARREGLRIKVFTPAPTADETLSRIRQLISRRTRAIAVPHITCTTGQLLPVREICTLARESGAWSLIDGAHGPGSLDLDLRDIGCDFYASCGHKWLCGPAGTGILYIRAACLHDLDTIFAGAYTDTGWSLSQDEQKMHGIQPNANRYAYGTQSAFLHGALATAIQFMDAIGMKNIELRHRELHNYLRERLQEIPRVNILTPAEERSRAGILSFEVPGQDIQALNKSLLVEKLRPRVVLESNWHALRISTHIFNDQSDLDRLVGSLKRHIS